MAFYLSSVLVDLPSEVWNKLTEKDWLIYPWVTAFCSCACTIITTITWPLIMFAFDTYRKHSNWSDWSRKIIIIIFICFTTHFSNTIDNYPTMKWDSKLWNAIKPATWTKYLKNMALNIKASITHTIQEEGVVYIENVFGSSIRGSGYKALFQQELNNWLLAAITSH